MTITYTWTIVNCRHDVSTGGIIEADWRLTGVDGEYTSSSVGSTPLTYDASSPDFTPYDQVSEAQVVGWVQDALTPDGVTSLQNGIAYEIGQKQAPTQENGTPWG